MIELKQQYRTSLCDMITPVAAYRLLRDQFPCSLLLESADYHDHSDSRSFICLDAIAGFEARGKSYSYYYPQESSIEKEAENGAEILKEFISFTRAFRTPSDSVKLPGSGLFGYTSFDAVQYMEEIEMSVDNNPDNRDIPDLKYHLFRYVLVFDHYKNELTIVGTDVNGGQQTDLTFITDLLKRSHSPHHQFKAVDEESSPISDQTYRDYVVKAVAHCKRGDVFQLVVSRSFQQNFKGDDFLVYRALRSINPSPYLFYFDFGDFKIFGSSPEAQIQVNDQIAEIHPIAGTVKRGDDSVEDKRQAKLLQEDQKERSEHVMLVDLARNDLSKHATNVEVLTYAEIQYFSHVIHMVSKVTGKLDEKVDSMTIYADTFPAGTLSGAPKYRALELINEIESIPRKFYGGSIGFFDFNGNVNHAIIIRSFLSKNNQLNFQAGAGVVADSQPEHELQEVNQKIAALRKAIQLAQTL